MKEKTHAVYVHAFGRLIGVTAVCESTDEANAYMEAHPGEGVILSCGNVALIARCTDLGTKWEPGK